LAASRPKSASLRVKLAEWLAKAGRRDEAVSDLYKLQEALSLQGDVLAAISAGLRIVQIDPTFDNPLSYVAKLTVERLKEETTTLQLPTDPQEQRARAHNTKCCRRYRSSRISHRRSSMASRSG
jgi:hypothetical protein